MVKGWSIISLLFLLGFSVCLAEEYNLLVVAGKDELYLNKKKIKRDQLLDQLVDVYRNKSTKNKSLRVFVSGQLPLDEIDYLLALSHKIGKINPKIFIYSSETKKAVEVQQIGQAFYVGDLLDMQKK